MKPYSCLFILSLLLASCGRPPEEGAAINEYTAGREAEKEPFILLSPSGDTIPTGVPIPAKGKWIDPDSVARPNKVPLKGQPKVLHAHTNVHPVGAPKVVPVPKELTVITPGKDGVPVPDTVPAQGKVVPALQTQPVPALLPRFKDNAIYDIQYLDVGQGMISSYINTIREDSRGNLWFGTDGGISRFDGNSFTHFTIEEGLNDNTGRSIIEDSKGNLWFGTYKGVSRYDGNTFTHYTTGEGLSGNGILSVLEDSRGNLWFGTGNGGVNRFDGANFIHYTTEQGLTHNQAFSILEDSRGNLWFGTWNGVSCFDGASFTHFTTEEGLSDNCVLSILEDRQGNLWFGTWFGGVNRFDGANFSHFTTEQGLSHNWVTSMIEDSRGNLWFGTWNGVSRFDGANFTHYTTKEGLSHNEIYSILKDSKGNLWSGTRGGGVNCLDFAESNKSGGSFTHYTTEEGLNQNNIRSILEDRQGNLWFGTRYGGVSRFDGANFTYYTTEEGLSQDNIQSILEDRQGNLWFGTWYGGVSCFDGASFTHYTTKEGLSQNWVKSMLEDSQGNIWFGTNNKGLNCYNGHSFIHYTTEEGLSNDNVMAILEDRNGNLWFGTVGGGVSCFDGASFTHYTTKEGLSNNKVMAILEDSNGKLWFGTGGGGVSCFDPDNGRGSFTYFTTEKGLSSNTVWSILEDSQKNIWISTEKGITVLAPLAKEANMANDSETDNYQFFTFDEEDGLKRADFNPNSAYLDHHNRIWWGSLDGLTMLDLNNFKLSAKPPQIRLEHIAIMDQFVDFRRLKDTSYRNSLPFGKSLSHPLDTIVPFFNYPVSMDLPHHLNHLTFHFSAIDWAAPHKIKYSYMLEGLDKNWSIPKLENKADYRNLPFGNYTIKVKAHGAAQKWSNTFEYNFVIRPPWWLTWWAYTFYALAIANLLYTLYRYLLNRQFEQAETRRLKELDGVKTRLYTNITHEFRTPLTVIQGVNELVREEGERLDSKKIVEHSYMIRRNSGQLLNLVNQMLNLRKLESGSLPVKMVQGDVIAFLKYLLESFHSLAESKNISLHFQSDLPDLTMDYDPEKLQQIVSNLLSNAIKFTPEGGEVRLTVDDGWRTADGGRHFTHGGSSILIQVNDSGIGIPEEQLPHIFDRFYQVDDSSTRRGEGTGIGLTLAKELIKLLGGEITVQSRVGEGTEFTVALPVRREAPMAAAPVKVAQAPAGVREMDLKAAGEEEEEAPLALIIEDNSDVVRYLQSCLSGAYRLETAFDGQAGIKKALELTPDIIISDVMMPEKDGFEVTQALKTDPRTSHIPIILLTARADVESRLAGLERGADAYLAKPFAREELLLRMRKLQELRLRLRHYYLGLAGAPTEVEAPPEAEPEHQAEDAFVQQVRALVEKHLRDFDYTVDQLCREMAMSRSQLHRKLTALTGYSANRFIRYIRLFKARQLLVGTEEPISNIAYDTGFSDPGYFARAFRKEFGVTPTEFREGG